MILYPAIDLKGGECVRLLQGDMEKAVLVNTDLSGAKMSGADLSGADLSGAQWRRRARHFGRG